MQQPSGDPRRARHYLYRPRQRRRVAYQPCQHWYPSAGALHLAGPHAVDRYFRADFEQLFPHERLPGNTPGQLHDREALWQMVQQDKARGYVIGESFFRHGISSIVYPVYDRSGRVAAVVSILVPSEEIPLSDRERLQNEVRLAADKISGFLGYLSQAS